MRAVAEHPVRALLESCRSLRQIKEAHGWIIKDELSPFDCSAASFLLSAYAVSSHGNIDYALSIFNRAQKPSIFVRNSIIRGFTAAKKPKDALLLFAGMLRRGFQPNNFTFPFVIKSCTEASLVECGASVHGCVVRRGLASDVYIRSTLIRFYAGSKKDLDGAQKVFDECSEQDVVSWNSMIDGYIKSGELSLARSIFDRMICKDTISWNTMINGYSLLGDLFQAKHLFDKMPHRNIVSWNSILAGCAKSGDVNAARTVFNEMPQRDVISWNAMLACYAQSGQPNEALELFNQMRCRKVKPTDATIVSLLSACAHLGALDQGIAVHHYMKDHAIEINTVLGTALVDMYAKCGDINSSEQIFRSLEPKDVLAWNTVIAGMAAHGHAHKALFLFDEMSHRGPPPDSITFTAVLSACSHCGMVEKGRQLLDSMEKDYKIEPNMEHYGCLIDLLARAGLLEEALEVIKNMPMAPNPGAWGAFLGGCKIHGNVHLAEAAAINLLELQPEHSGRYIVLANIYAAARRYDESRRVRQLMEARGVVKSPGVSMLEIEGIVHQFVAGDRSHPKSDAIREKLSEISTRLKIEAGYCPQTEQVMFDVEEEEKENSVFFHSEKLAVAFALLVFKPRETIRVVKNLRVCSDCHQFTKLVSSIYGREIIMRDRNRFHHFSAGTCSCGDYW